MDNPSENSDRTEVKVRMNSQRTSQAHERTVATNERNSLATKKKRALPVRVLLAALAALVVIAGIAWYIWSENSNALIDGSRYQAVFFTNGQVYFGKLNIVDSEYMRIENVFYLQTKADEKSGKQKNPQEATAADASNVELVKLGGEIHGPTDEMIISKDQVLFFENLKTDGDVSQTIAEYLEKNNSNK